MCTSGGRGASGARAAHSVPAGETSPIKELSGLESFLGLLWLSVWSSFGESIRGGQYFWTVHLRSVIYVVVRWLPGVNVTLTRKRNLSAAAPGSERVSVQQSSDLW